MPGIERYGCNQCDLKLPIGWGGYTYVVNDAGERVVCGHPGEHYTVEEVTGLSYSEAEGAGRIGYARHFLCLECVAQSDLDVDRDELACPSCSSRGVRRIDHLVGQRCPRCKSGIIEKGSLVRWKLDSDWAQLPVPQVVKDLIEFTEKRIAPASLHEAEVIAVSFSNSTFFTIATRFLNAWEGECFSDNQDPPGFIDLNFDWPWCRAIPLVLEVLPELAELMVIEDEKCQFADNVPPEVRRGIKNYVRKHRTHFIMA